MTAIANKLLEEAKTKVQSIARIGRRVVTAYSEEALLDSVKMVTLPAVGVSYGGMRAVAEPGRDTNRKGASAEFMLNLIVIVDRPGAAEGIGQIKALETLDDLRNAFMEETSTSGHKWRFVSEMLVAERGKIVIWLQRWSTPVQLVVPRIT